MLEKACEHNAGCMAAFRLQGHFEKSSHMLGSQICIYRHIYRYIDPRFLPKKTQKVRRQSSDHLGYLNHRSSSDFTGPAGASG